MAQDRELSTTMRIDLIPDVPSEPVAGKRKRVVISTPSEAPESHQKTAAVDGSSRYEELFQSVYDAAIVCDLKGTIVDVNVRAVEFLLYERAELCGLSIVNIISGADSSLIGTLIDNLENERFTVIQAYCVCKDGSLFPSEIAVNKLKLGTLHLCFFVRDVTLRKQSEEMLITEHNAIQNAGNGIAVAGMDLKLEYLNPAVAQMWGCDNVDRLMGMSVSDMFSDRKLSDQMVDALAHGSRSWIRDVRARRLNKEEFYVQVSAACSRNSDGEVVGFVFSFVDISDRNRAEEAERELERRRVMLESLGAACHHLGQPATVLLANLGVIRSRLKNEDESILTLIQDSMDAVDRLGKILHKLNAVNEYKTMEYLKNADGDESRILDI